MPCLDFLKPPPKRPNFEKWLFNDWNYTKRHPIIPFCSIIPKLFVLKRFEHQRCLFRVSEKCQKLPFLAPLKRHYWCLKRFKKTNVAISEQKQINGWLGASFRSFLKPFFQNWAVLGWFLEIGCLQKQHFLGSKIKSETTSPIYFWKLEKTKWA